MISLWSQTLTGNTADLWLFTAWLLIGMPLLGRGLFAYLAAGQGGRRLQVYSAIILLEWCMAAAVGWIAQRHHVSWAALGLGPLNVARSAGVCLTLLLVLAALVVQNVRQLRRMTRSSLSGGLGRAQLFYPQGSVGHGAFFVLAASTGICEELVYRGLLLSFLGAVSHAIWAGVLLSSIVFGVGHAYQGIKGVVTTSVLGLLFAGIYVFTESLYAGQLLHLAVNLINGIVGAHAVSLLRRAPTAAEGLTIEGSQPG